jgi:hypothetical protein
MLIVFIIVLALLIVMSTLVSSFAGVYECDESKRLFPEGKIPGDYLGVNKYTEDQLTKKFNQTPELLVEEYVKFKKSNFSS